MNPVCVGPGYTFELCCLNREQGCFNQDFTFEFCCPGAAKVAPYFGNPNCFQGQAFYTFERCCVFNDTKCFDFSFPRPVCCGQTEHLPQSAHLTSQCGEVKPVLGRGNQWKDVFLPFRKLTRVISVRLFSAIGSPINGSFQLLANSGLGMRSLSRIEISENLAQKEIVLEDPVDVYSLALRRQRVEDPQDLYFAARGCPAVNRSVVVLHCQPRNLMEDQVKVPELPMHLMEDLYNWLVIKRHAEDSGSCFQQLDVSLRELQAQRRLGEITVLLSPYLRSWHLQTHSIALWRLTQLISPEFSVLGLPTWSQTFTWPLRRLRRQYWKLQALDYPTGSARSAPHRVGDKGSELCHGGDMVSASRVYKSSVLENLLEGLKAEAGAEWLLNLDLEALAQGVNHRTYLCAVGIFDEDDYLQHVKRLTSHISLRYHIEVARLGPDSHVNCAVTLQWGQVIDGPVVLSTAGMVTPWCFRRSLRKAWRELTTWWSKLSPLHYVVPSDGTALCLLRNTEEPIPWDHDVDIWLRSSGPLKWLPDFAAGSTGSNEALQNLSGAGFKWTTVTDYTARGGGVHVEMNFLDQVDSDDSGVVTIDLDVVFKEYAPKTLFPLPGKFFGTQAATGEQHLVGVAKKYGSAQKLHRSGKPFSCSKPGHPACIPATKPACEGCEALTVEFEDSFILLDWFE